jgi:hypothetical protein
VREELETLNNVTPSKTAIAMEAMETIHAVALDAFHCFCSQTALRRIIIIILFLLFLQKRLRLSRKCSQHHQGPS